MAERKTHVVFGIEVSDLARRLFALLTGTWLIMAFYGLDETATTMRYSVLGSAKASSPGEPYFWLAHALFVTPGACLVGWGLSPWIASSLGKLTRRLDAATARGQLLALAGLGTLTVLVYRLARALYLHDFPVTTSELSAKFAGRILAKGEVSMPAPPLYEHMPRAFDWFDGTKLASSEWPGASFFAMLSELGAGPWLHLLMAALPLVALAWLFSRLWSTRWGLLAAGIFIVSPMSFTLSMSEHPHLLSRAFVALFIALCGVGMHNLEDNVSATGARHDASPPGSRLWIGAGLSLGAGLTCRPVAVLVVCMPILIWVLWRAAQSSRVRAACIYLLLGTLAPLALFAWYNLAVTGNPLLPPRWSAHAGDSLLSGYDAAGGLDGLWTRFGTHIGYSLLLLGVWFLGPLGLVLVTLGVTADRFSRLLALGLVSTLTLAFFQPVASAHHLGPLHFAELAPVLVVLAVSGTRRLKGWLQGLAIGFHTVAASLAGVLVLVGVTFISWHGNMLDRSSNTSYLVAGFLERASAQSPPAVVLVPDFISLWQRFPQFQQYGSWVLQWRPNRPDASGHFVILLDEPGLAERAASAYPDRAILRLVDVEGEELKLIPAL